MNISEIKSEVDGMTLDERRQLTAYLVSLRHKELSGYREKLAEKIDDTDSEHWFSFEEFDRRVTA
ncbi:hypothetical protein N9A94_08310 [Akkermansiaceae bacterium]|nr:hypothetical protein [Akkermansiaceae bacterium]MDB4538182.1 hypothetical protein [Akkermansiaceae bacterium]MDB4544734.1 hypothetical protein [Akkermansiaceae bacterium]